MTIDRELTCLTEGAARALPLHAVRPAGLGALLAALPPAQARFLEASGFGAAVQELRLLPGTNGIDGAVLGLGDDRSPWAFGDLAMRLPERTDWRLVPGDYDQHAAALGFCLGAYAYPAFKQPKREPARLAVADEHAGALREAGAAWMVRDLINAPANVLGPAELGRAALALADKHGAKARLIAGDELAQCYPAVAAVGRGSARAPCVAVLTWPGSGASNDRPLLSLVRQGRLLRFRRLRSETLRRDAAHEEGHGRGGSPCSASRGWSWRRNCRSGSSLRLGCVENQRLRQRHAPAGRAAHAARPYRRGRQHRRRGPARLVPICWPKPRTSSRRCWSTAPR